jgi:hypothetical protein
LDRRAALEPAPARLDQDAAPSRRLQMDAAAYLVALKKRKEAVASARCTYRCR